MNPFADSPTSGSIHQLEVLRAEAEENFIGATAIIAKQREAIVAAIRVLESRDDRQRTENTLAILRKALE